MKWLVSMGVAAAICAGAVATWGAGELQHGLSGDSKVPAASKVAQPEALPPDVDPDSRARLPLVQREAMSEEGKKVYDLFVSPQVRSLAGLQGPYGIWLHSPKLAEREQALNYYLRYETGLGRRLTELAILVTAREVDNQFEWTLHEPAARKEGLEPAIIEVVKRRKSTAGLGEKEASIISLGREVFRRHKVSSATFARALKAFGEEGLVNVAALLGNYAGVSALINTFDIQLQPDQKPLLPLP
jgi:4-carboxymuconolactone decarboxylase